MVAPVGVLALQGDFEAHGRMLEALGVPYLFVRKAADLDQSAALIIPGGESTTMWKLLRQENLVDPLAAYGRTRPVFGTCAGAILIASKVTHPDQESFGFMDIAVERNAYGRQVDSRVVVIQPEAEFEDRTEPGELETVFIRAPIIRGVGDDVTVLARYNGDPVLVEQGPHMAATFHPELTEDSRVHRLFLARLAVAAG